MQAWAGFEVKHRSYVKAYELFAQALASEQANGDPDRQVSLLKAWGDAKVLEGSLEEAQGLYEQALGLQPDSLLIIVVTCYLTVLTSYATLDIYLTIMTADV